MPMKPVSKPKPLAIPVPAVTVDEKALMKQSSDLATEANALAVKDQASYNAGALMLTKVKQYIKYLEGIFGPAKTALNAAVKNLRDEEKRIIGPRLTFATGLETSLKTKMATFIQEEERRKRKAEEDARIKAEKEAEAERKKLEKKAEKAEDKGQDSKAEQLRLQAAAVTPAPVSVSPAVSYAGTGTMSRDDIEWELLNAPAFLDYLLHSGAPVGDMIEFKNKPVKDYLKKIMLASETTMNIPGIKVEKKKIISSRA